MSQTSQSTTITGAFIGYLPGARIAEFRDESSGAVIVAAVEIAAVEIAAAETDEAEAAAAETDEAKRRSIKGILNLRCQAVIEPRTPAGPRDPKYAIVDFQATEQAAKPHWHRQEAALTADAYAIFHDGSQKLLPVRIEISPNPAQPELWTAVIKVAGRQVPNLQGSKTTGRPTAATMPVYAGDHPSLEAAAAYAEEMLNLPSERLKSEISQAAGRREQAAEEIGKFLAATHRKTA